MDLCGACLPCCEMQVLLKSDIICDIDFTRLMRCVYIDEMLISQCCEPQVYYVTGLAPEASRWV